MAAQSFPMAQTVEDWFNKKQFNWIQFNAGVMGTEHCLADKKGLIIASVLCPSTTTKCSVMTPVHVAGNYISQSAAMKAVEEYISSKPQIYHD